MSYRIEFPEGKTFCGSNIVEISDEDAEIFIRQIFAQMRINTVENTLVDYVNKQATPEQVKQIADNLYDEIFDGNELYWELEDKNILYIAYNLGITDENAWETAF